LSTSKTAKIYYTKWSFSIGGGNQNEPVIALLYRFKTSEDTR
jgi:hypothetical protein